MSIERWEIAGSSTIQFTVRHLLVSKVRGWFSRWSGAVLVPDDDWDRATVEVSIDASSIDTGIAERDRDLRSANFLDVARYPEITFRGLHVGAQPAGRLRVVGELAIRGRMGEVPLEVESSSVALDGSGPERARFFARSSIRRQDFGVSGNVAWDHYGVMIGERIDIELHVDAVRQPVTAISFPSGIHDLTTSQG